MSFHFLRSVFCYIGTVSQYLHMWFHLFSLFILSRTAFIQMMEEHEHDYLLLTTTTTNYIHVLLNTYIFTIKSLFSLSLSLSLFIYLFFISFEKVFLVNYTIYV